MSIINELKKFDEANFDDEEVQQRFYKLIEKHCFTMKSCSHFWSKCLEHLKSKNPKRYFLTLTSKEDNPHEIRRRLERVINYYDGELIEYVFELTKEGIPHIHAIWSTQKSPRTRDLYRLNCKNSIKNVLIRRDGDMKRIKTYLRKDVGKMQKYIGGS